MYHEWRALLIIPCHVRAWAIAHLIVLVCNLLAAFPYLCYHPQIWTTIAKCIIDLALAIVCVLEVKLRNGEGNGFFKLRAYRVINIGTPFWLALDLLIRCSTTVIVVFEVFRWNLEINKLSRLGVLYKGYLVESKQIWQHLVLASYWHSRYLCSFLRFCDFWP